MTSKKMYDIIELTKNTEIMFGIFIDKN